MKNGNAYQFGPFRQDPAARILTRDGMPVAITPKAFDTLFYLVSNSGRTVTREEIIRAVWPDTFVEEGNLNYNISQIRKTLGDCEPGVPYIQTLPKQGYRFVAEVIAVANGAPQFERAPSLRPNRAAVVLIAAVPLAFIAYWLIPARVSKAKGEAGLIRLTSDSGLTMTPALSPDGKSIVYASDRSGSGNHSLWIQPLGEGAPLRLTQGAADDYAPSFSPDGRTIAFRSERGGGGVYIVSVSSGETRKIAPSGRRPRFSPDGKWIAYWVGIEGGDTTSFFMVPGAGKVYIVPVAGGSPREIQPQFAAAGYPVWMPDSRHLLFLGNRDPNEYREDTMDWWVAPIDGGAAVSAGANAAFRKLGLPTVSQAPDTWIENGPGVLMSAAMADTQNIWRVPISPRTWQVSGTPQRLTWGTTMDVQPSVMQNRLVFASLNATLDIWSLPLDPDQPKPAGGLERLTRDAIGHSYPAVSPDGAKLAFSTRSSASRDIWVKDLRSGQETLISRPPEPSFNPIFSPDSRELIYRSAGRQTQSAYLVPVDGGSRQQVCEDCSDYGWSADGKRLVVVGKSPARVFLLDLESRQSTPLLDHSRYLLWNARLSGDGRWVAFNATTPGRSRIFLAPVRGGGLVPESEWIAITEGGWDDKPRWSPHGDFLYFISQRDGFRCIWAQRLDGRKRPIGPPVAVLHAHDARRSLSNVGIGDLSISVARDKLVFNMSERTGNLWATNLDGVR